ncbi:MAG: hypothetical protein R6W31_06360 [Bacteroidales bacterium]
MKLYRILIALTIMISMSGCNHQKQKGSDDLFAKENLVAWCIVPFDSVERTPEERAEMLDELGISQLAYDYRDKHIPSFKREIEVLNEHQIDLRAVWLWLDPRGDDILGDAGRAILETLEETGTHTELWVSFPEEVFHGLSDDQALYKAVTILSSVVEVAEEIGCTIALYNHGDWFGEPENQVRIIRVMENDQVRIVYNFHHGHQQVERFTGLMDLMMPYLSAININGMKVEGPQIINLGEGDRELEMLKIIAASGYKGSIGIIGHTEGEDIRVVLERNLKGLDRLRSQI